MSLCYERSVIKKMMFLGFNSGLGDIHSADYTPTVVDNINKIILSNGIYDSLYITKDVSNYTYPLTKVWNYDTIMYAKFENILFAGNIDLALSQISNVRIKRREVNSYNWTVIFDIPISKASDLLFEKFDKYCRAKTAYEYALVTMLNGVESSVLTSTIQSDFDGLYIMTKDQTFYSELEIQISPIRNHPSQIINTPSGRFPITIYNSENNYDTFSVKCMLIDKDIDGNYDKSNAWKYRNSVKDFLFDGMPKIIKLEDGREWLVNIYDNINDDESQAIYEGYTLTTFSCVEAGDSNDTQTLYDDGLIDINTDYFY